ncbi:hypothetical protein CGCS363_v007018 [Colletotrichum siamense]|uniref:uncharacterized protein n=1 Tax=Colletotrichum siamense TaxID=690259 RepID=UPI001873121D|nr:uncharacterized protein CGCS363_v007018 [Colletotrichum siamense]KAF5501611.1 hypothetical protein CGCS363_v007018 [Colletotrichum siamense]
MRGLVSLSHLILTIILSTWVWKLRSEVGELSSKLSYNTAPVNITVPSATESTAVTTEDNSIYIVPHPFLPSNGDGEGIWRWPASSKTCIDNECKETGGLPARMNLDNIYKRGSGVVERAQGDWEVYNHYFKIYLRQEELWDRLKHLAELSNVIRSGRASGVVTDQVGLMLFDKDYYKGFFDDDTIVAISKMEGVKKIEHMRKVAGNERRYDDYLSEHRARLG